MWRACRNLLPTKDNLLHMKVISEPSSPVCGLETETAFYILWDCPSARDVWGASEKLFQKCSFTGSDFIQVAEGILTRCGREALISFIILARKIWFRRNSVVHGGCFSHPNSLVQEMRKSVDEYKQIRIVEENKQGLSHETTPSSNIKWAQLCGITGELLWQQKASHIWDNWNQQWGKPRLLVMRQCCLGSLHLTPIILEGDARNVVAAVKSNECNWSRIDHLAADTRTILETNIYVLYGSVPM